MGIHIDEIKDQKLRERLLQLDREQNRKQLQPVKSPVISGKRLRQSSKPLMNKLEAQFHAELIRMYSGPLVIHAQAITFRLANGLRYTPDFFTFNDFFNNAIAWEVKGKWVDGDSFPKLKMAAATYPEIKWRLVWKDNEGRWQTQNILP